MKKSILILASLAITGITCCQPVKKGHNIAVRVDGLSNDGIYLAYHLGNRQYIKDSLRLDQSGSGVFAGENLLDQGVYIIVLPGNSYFEFLVTENQHFSIEGNKDDLINSIVFTGSRENTAFAGFQKEWAAMHKKSEAIRNRLSANRENSDSIRIITEASRDHEVQMKNYMNRTIDNNSGNFAGTLIKAMMPVEIPEFDIPSNIANRDSLLWVKNYNYNKEHFFDNLDLGDERLLRSPMYHSKLQYYFTELILQFPDSINLAVDKVLALSEVNKKTFQYVAVYLFNHFRESPLMGHDAVVVNLADEVYLSGKADWASADFVNNLRRDVDRLRPSLIGNKAINITMQSQSHGIISLDNIRSEFTILYFWEPDCGHCKEATPLLHDFYMRNREKGIEVFSICTQPDKTAWEKYISDNGLKWINGWDPDRATHYEFFYNIVSTPIIFILDRDKKIIAKKLPAESVEAFIESYRLYGR